MRYYLPLEVRYGDIDGQGHVNNACYLTYLEQARVAYLIELGLWDGRSFLDIGMILADVHLALRAPITLRQPIRVGARVTRLGGKSFTMENIIEDRETGQVLAEATTVLVAYDYENGQSVPIPPHWREAIAAYENIPKS